MLMDNFENKRLFTNTMLEELLIRRNEVQKFLDDNIAYKDHELMWQRFLQNPALGYALVVNNSLTKDQKYSFILNEFATKSMISLVIGRRGGGKTAFVVKFLEDLHRIYNKRVAVIHSTMNLPDYFEIVESPTEVDNDVVLMWDEASIDVSARRAMSKDNVELTSIMATLRHRNSSLIFITQHSGLPDLNIVRMSDCLFIKQLSMDEILKAERKDRSISVLKQFMILMMPKTQRECLYTDGDRWYLFENDLPSFWSDDISKSFRKITRLEAVDLAAKLAEKYPLKTVQKMLSIRGQDASPEEIAKWIENPDKAKKVIRKIYGNKQQL